MHSQHPSSESLTRRLQGQQLARVVFNDKQRLILHFSGDISLVIETGSGNLSVAVEQAKTSNSSGTSAKQPTNRQLEYLSFIAKYVSRFGRAPAESDIERHFLVSAPSVNQMMRMLERQGFITRQLGVPRSARICIDLSTMHSTK